MKKIHNPNALRVLAAIHGEKPSVEQFAQHARVFILSNEDDRQAYLVLYASQHAQRIQIIRDKPKFTDDGRYMTFARWRDSKPEPPGPDAEIAAFFPRTERTFSLQVFDMTKEAETAEAILNDPTLTVFFERSRFYADGRCFLALHWYRERPVEVKEEAPAPQRTEPAPPRKKRRRRRRRVPQESAVGYSDIAQLLTAPTEEFERLARP